MKKKFFKHKFKRKVTQNMCYKVNLQIHKSWINWINGRNCAQIDYLCKNNNQECFSIMLWHLITPEIYFSYFITIIILENHTDISSIEVLFYYYFLQKECSINHLKIIITNHSATKCNRIDPNPSTSSSNILRWDCNSMTKLLKLCH